MNLSTRSLGLAMLLLLLFLGTTLALQWWLGRETRQLKVMAIEEQRGHFLKALTLSGRGPDRWDAAFEREIGAALDGTVEFLKPGAHPSPSTGDEPGLTFVQEIASAPGWAAQVRFAFPALKRIQVLHQRTLSVIVVLALLVTTVPLLLVLIGSRRTTLPEGASRMPWATSRAQALGMEHLARVSNERSVALELEQGARQRAEETLEVNRGLLSQSVEERVRLGRELHDNISQTLYAVCLTLESVQKKNTLVPELRLRVDQCMTELKRLNQEVRSYLQELEPARLNGQTFSGAVTDMLAAFQSTDGVRFEQRLDEEAVSLIPPYQTADIMNILREAVSNSLRHGGARHVALLGARSDQEIALAVHDDGAGFVAANGSTGHGLANMEARASALGGRLRIESTPGKGTRVLLTLPVASPA